MNTKRGDICLAALDQVIRKEISKTRPQITAKKIIASTPASRSCLKGVAGMGRNTHFHHVPSEQPRKRKLSNYNLMSPHFH